MDALFALQAVSQTGIIGALIVFVIVIVVGRFLLKLALKAVILAALIAGALWLLGFSLPDLLTI